MSGRAPDPSLRALLRGRPLVAASMRPPWALAEGAFVDACTRCGECIRRCPERVLGVGDGGFPVVLARAGECTFCRACVDGCAPGALQPGSERAWDRHARIDTGCLTRNGIVCQSCRDACPEGAIRFRASAGIVVPEIDAERCTACGACAAVCPAAAIALEPMPMVGA